MHYRILLGIGLALAAVIVGALSPGLSSANPTGLAISGQTCTADGTVDAVLTWSPDSAGQQFVDLTGRNDNFNSAYSTGGPYEISKTSANLVSLQPETTYYTRVNTRLGTQFLRSEMLSFTTISCSSDSGSGGSSAGRVSGPMHLQGAAISATAIRLQWRPGSGNRFFCVDYARSPGDLLTRTGTWRNSGCGNTSNSHVVRNLACGTTYYARIWTSAGGGLYSPLTSVTTLACSNVISEPTDLEVLFTTETMARVDWTPGLANRWYCVDTARSRADLLDLEGTWRNHACWTAASQVTIGGLRCDTTYYLRVYAWNEITNVYSDVITFHTDDCDSENDLVEAPIHDVDVDEEDGAYLATVEAGLPNACHSFASYEVQRSGNVIEITVLNSVTDADVCAQVFSTYELTINLGDEDEFIGDVAYTVIVNDDESDTFTAN